MGFQPVSGGRIDYDYDGVSSGSVAANAVLTYAHTTDSGSDSCLGVVVMTDSLNVPTGVTWDGDALTKAGEYGADNRSVSIWWRVAPGAKTANIVVTCSGAEDIHSYAVTLHNVHQITPAGAIGTGTATGTNPDIDITGYANGVELAGISNNSTGITAPDTQHNLASISNVGGMWSNGVLQQVLPYNYQPQYFLEEPAGSDANVPFLYVFRSSLAHSSLRSKLLKVSLKNADFGTALGGLINISSSTAAGQPARYQGAWHIPSGAAATLPREITTVGTGNIGTDTIGNPVASASNEGHNHLANLNHQLVGILASYGVNVLKEDGDPQTDADWGARFEVGDKNERAVSLRGLGGLTFVLNIEGLYSFNAKGRSGMVLEDFRMWRTVFANLNMQAWRGGLLIPHPSGLLFYTPGQLPLNVGVDQRADLSVLPPSGTTELHGGRYHSLSIAGDYIYAVYQADVSSTSALVVAAYLDDQDNPTSLVWQVLGALTLQAADTTADMMGCHVAVSGRPDSTDYVTPTLWFGNSESLNYVLLDHRASPFRSRVQTHKVNLSCAADMSVLEFVEPMDLTRIVVHTSADMLAGDEFQVSLLADGTGRDEKVGAPIKGSGTRHERKVNRHSVSSLVLRITWTATSAVARVPPVIKRIDLYGTPAKGQASA